MKKVMLIALSVAIMLVFDAFAATTFVSPYGWRISNGCSSKPGYASGLHTHGSRVEWGCTGSNGTCYTVNGSNLTVYTNMNLQLDEEEITEYITADPAEIE